MIAVGIIVVGIIFIMLPKIAGIFSGWTVNENTYPPVFGPGDEFKYYFDTTIASIHDHNRAQVHIKFRNKKDLGIKEKVVFETSTNEKPWPKVIKDKSIIMAGNSIKQLWAKITIPDMEKLQGETLKLRLLIYTTYPTVIPGTKKYRVENQSLTEELEIHLSSRGAAGSYKNTFWMGLLLGNILLVLAGLKLYIGTKRGRKISFEINNKRGRIV